MSRTVLPISRFLFTQSLGSLRCKIVGLSITMLLYDGINRINQYSEQSGDFIPPFLFAHMTSMEMLQFFLIAGFLIIVCDAPFMGRDSYTLLIRTGRTPWGMGVTLTLFFFAIAYALFLFSLPLVFTLPSLGMSSDWGKALTTLSRYPELRGFMMFQVSERILLNFTPSWALIHAFTLECEMLFLLALVMLSVNLLSGKKIGVYVSLAIAMADLMIPFGLGDGAYRYSPASLARIVNLDPSDLGLLATPRYAYAFMGGGILLFLFISLFLFRHKSVDILSKETSL